VESTKESSINNPISSRNQVEQSTCVSGEPSDTLFKNLVATIPIPMIITRKADGEILFVNELFADTFGIKFVELIGLKASRFYCNPDDRLDMIKTITDQGRLRDFELLCKKEDGTPIKMMVYIESIKFMGQDSLLCSFYDIQYKNGHFNKTNRSEDLYASVVNNIGIGVALIGPNMEILTLNDQMQKWNPNVNVETRPICFKAFNTPPSESICQYCPTAKTLADGLVHESITETSSENGIRNYRIISSPVKDLAGNVKFAIEMVEDVTERLAIENALQESERKVRAILDQTFQFIALLNPDGTLVDVNKSALEFSGIKATDVLGKPFWEGPWWTHSVDLQEKLKGAINDAARGQFIRFEVTHPDKEGNLHDVDFSLKPIMDDNGNVVYLIPEGRDITESKLAEKALRNTQQMLQLVMDSIPQRIFWKNSDLYYLGCNKNAAKDAGLADPDMIIGKTDFDLSWKALAEYYRADDLQVMNNGKPKLNYEEKITYPDGSELWVLTNKVPLRDQEDKIVGLLGTYEDITDRKKAEHAIRESQAMISRSANLYNAMINTVPAIIYYKNTDNKYIVVNDAFCKFVGLPADQIISNSDLEIFPPEKAKGNYEVDMRVMANDTAIINQEEQISDIKGQTKWIAITKVPLHDSMGSVYGIVGLTQDITEFHNSRQQLIQSDKLAAIGTLAAGVAHEINNPIGYVNSNLNAMTKYLNKITQYIENSGIHNDKEKMKEILLDFGDAISESIEGSGRVRKIVADLKSFSRADQADKVYTDINEGIKSTLNIVWNELKYKCKVESDYGTLPDLYCIPNQLNQIFMNILVNAGQAITGDAGLIKIKTWADDQHVYVSIADNGCGIPEENMKKVFEPFFTTKDVGKGTGLGLSLTYDIIKKHNGKIDVTSEVGIGTEFTISLPLEGLDG
jgi:PAS domain S-box-containing protein